MRFPRLPRLPVSRRRHEQINHRIGVLDKLEQDLVDLRHERGRALRRASKLRDERDEAVNRVAELKQAIRSHKQSVTGALKFDGYGFAQADRDLYRVLDGHDRQEPQECICWASSYCPLHEHRDTPRGGRR